MTAVLVADNDVDYLELLGRIVGDRGFKVISASNSSDARRIIEQHEADVAVLDLRLEDSSDDDISGLQVAENTDRMIPKIIVSIYNLSEAAQRFSIDLSGFPSVVGFVKKDRVATDLMPSIEKALKIKHSWSMMTQNTVSSHLYEDYKAARNEARIHYIVSLLLTIGFALPLVIGAFWLHSGHASLAILFAASGILIGEVTNYLLGKKLEFLNARVEKFHAELLQTNRFEQLLGVSYNIKDEERRERFKEELFNSAVRQWFPRSYSTSTNRRVNIEPESLLDNPTGDVKKLPD